MYANKKGQIKICPFLLRMNSKFHLQLYLFGHQSDGHKTEKPEEIAFILYRVVEGHGASVIGGNLATDDAWIGKRDGANSLYGFEADCLGLLFIESRTA